MTIISVAGGTPDVGIGVGGAIVHPRRLRSSSAAFVGSSGITEFAVATPASAKHPLTFRARRRITPAIN